MICISLSSDRAGFARNATVLGSVIRRTREDVWVKFYCQGFLADSFEVGRLRVDFVRAREEIKGNYPGHVVPAAFDRLRVMKDASEWDRCLIMDHDMLALCDLKEYFAEDFGDNLLMGRLFGEGNTLGHQMKPRGGLPETWKHAENHPYFYMGPMMNIAAMREHGTWCRLMDAHVELKEEEQLALAAATDGRTKGVSRKWNLVPQWDNLEALADEVSRGGFTNHGGLEWNGSTPVGIIHWTGFQKPWHYGSRVWRADLWESEETNWEELRAGSWNKPISVEVGDADASRARALARRGWVVKLMEGPKNTCSSEAAGSRELAVRRVEADFPDLERVPFMAEIPLKGIEMVRFTSQSLEDRTVDIEAWVKADRPGGRSNFIVLEGPVDRSRIELFKSAGYHGEARIEIGLWPGGGPAPSALDYEVGWPSLNAVTGEHIYLTCEADNLPFKKVDPEWLAQRLGEERAIAMMKCVKVLSRSGNEISPSPSLKKLHLGCGKNRLEGWENLDMPLVDIRRPLPFPTACADFIFLEHVIEHVSPPDAYRFMMEAWRLLKPGGVLRLTFPDVCRIATEADERYFALIKNLGWGDGSPGSAIRAAVTCNGHLGVWSERTMCVVLESIGFAVTPCAVGESAFDELKDVERHGDQVGDAINRMESSCVDAVKVTKNKNTR